MALTPEEIYMRDREYFLNEELIEAYQQEIDIYGSNFRAMAKQEQTQAAAQQCIGRISQLEELLDIAFWDMFMDDSMPEESEEATPYC